MHCYLSYVAGILYAIFLSTAFLTRELKIKKIMPVNEIAFFLKIKK
jgi:hypothetical protein